MFAAHTYIHTYIRSHFSSNTEKLPNTERLPRITLDVDSFLDEGSSLEQTRAMVELPRLWVVGTATSVPGQTREQGAQVILDALRRAAQGENVFPETPGQRGAWLNKRFIATELNAGLKTWKFFKRNYAEMIELDEEQQWVRLAADFKGA